MNMNFAELLEKRRIKVMICMIGVISAFCGIILLYKVTGMNYGQYSQKTEIVSGWTVTGAEHTYSHVQLNTFYFNDLLVEGQTVSLCRKLPDVSQYDSPVLIVETHNSVIKVAVNGKTVYSYGQERYAANKLVGSGFHIIELPENEGNDTVKLELTSTGDSYITQMGKLYITDYSNIYTELLTKYRVSYMVSIFLIFAGFVLILSGSAVGFMYTWFFRLIWLGIFSLTVGIWTMCHYDIFQLYAIPMYMCTLIEYACLYAGPMPLLFFFSGYVTECEKSYMHTLYKVLIAIHGGITFLLFLLHFMGVLHLPKLIILEHIIIVIVCVYLMALMVMRIKQGKKTGNFIITGCMVLIICIVMELSNYLFEKYSGKTIIPNISLAALGTIFFIAVLLLSFGWDIAGKLVDAKEKAVLYKMAYTDNLTGIYNRRYCEERLQYYENNDVYFGIFNFDLNGLKSINDSCGHSSGDELIKGFAQILKKVFGEIGVVGRMGGDEFIVIVENPEECYFKKAIVSLLEAIQEANQNDEGYVFSTAYGYADSTEIVSSGEKRDVNKVYQLADNRMYEHKKTCHDARK